MSLEKAYSDIKEKFGNVLEIEPFCVVKSVDDHRNFWKPEKVRVLLLAESHVYTSVADHGNVMRYDGFQELSGCPGNYVKLVYCLGYGEKDLVRVSHTTGTPPFWKIFVSCTSQNFRSEFGKILVSQTTDFHQRVRNKISVLEKLKEKGIWLVDASIVALYNNKVKPSPKTMDEVMMISWRRHVSKVVAETGLEKIVVIGRGVARALGDELKKTKIPFEVQPQPQARLSRGEIGDTFEKYYKFCNSL